MMGRCTVSGMDGENHFHVARRFAALITDSMQSLVLSGFLAPSSSASCSILRRLSLCVQAMLSGTLFETTPMGKGATDLTPFSVLASQS